MKYPILSENSAYTFSDYFKLVDYRDEILEHFGYSFQKKNYQLPRFSVELPHLDKLKALLEKNIHYISLINETAKREFIIAPIAFTDCMKDNINNQSLLIIGIFHENWLGCCI